MVAILAYERCHMVLIGNILCIPTYNVKLSHKAKFRHKERKDSIVIPKQPQDTSVTR